MVTSHTLTSITAKGKGFVHSPSPLHGTPTPSHPHPYTGPYTLITLTPPVPSAPPHVHSTWDVAGHTACCVRGVLLVRIPLFLCMIDPNPRAPQRPACLIEPREEPRRSLRRPTNTPPPAHRPMSCSLSPHYSRGCTTNGRSSTRNAPLRPRLCLCSCMFCHVMSCCRWLTRKVNFLGLHLFPI
jgi:hypothetical protein